MDKSGYNGDRLRRAIIDEYLGWRRHRAEGRSLIVKAPYRERGWLAEHDEKTGLRMVSEADVAVGVLNRIRHQMFDRVSAW
jgi:hypothetical protein